ncbi:SDR family oxidoreductase [Chachezhania sediminis]|uniref:SDR family oxidoreductase n=1 Tax=Chachezhania sediminis TaxID=2599291 RepID=UPI00131AC271|nr:SDR family oxidoreductase [Chachezhania sediminis]
MNLTLDFAGKTVVVVGGTSGINRGVAEGFAAAGAKVAVASRNPEKVADTVKALEAAGAEVAMGTSFDVRDPVGVAEGLASFQAKLGDFDVLVSGAAGNFPALMSEMSNNAFKTVVDIDLMGTVHVMKAAYPFLRRPGASVISISAPQAYLPCEGQVHVCAAKAGVDQITRTLAMEWGHEGIRINSVVPGFIEETEGAERLAPTDEAKAATMAAIPLNRFGTKADIAGMCLFLSSPLASYVSGTVIAVDGALYQGGLGMLSQQLGTMLRQVAGR